MPDDISDKKITDGKRRLPLYSAAEAHFKLSRMNSNCYELYAFDKLPGDEEITGDDKGILNVPAHDYLLRGLIAMKRAELAGSKSAEEMFFERARASFQMSLKAKPDYLCAFRFLMDVSERLGLEDEVEEMKYAAQINHNMNHECPFLNPSYLSAEELVDIVKRSQTIVEEGALLRDQYKIMRSRG
ncbi:hypothetical protein HY494_00840 [Candidatus Woesearchaeota archaeon]|nr:hypothetical protein [Candidatus Woesearchaeota archaeon]